MTSQSKALAGIKILVVDDSPDIRMLMNLFLTREGAVVEEAIHAEDAIAKTAKNEYAVVLMDIQMPGMDGYEALDAVRKRGYQRPIIALTAHAMKEERDRILQAGFNDYATKPVQWPKLIETILQWAKT